MDQQKRDRFLRSMDRYLHRLDFKEGDRLQQYETEDLAKAAHVALLKRLTDRSDLLVHRNGPITKENTVTENMIQAIVGGRTTDYLLLAVEPGLSITGQLKKIGEFSEKQTIRVNNQVRIRIPTSTSNRLILKNRLILSHRRKI